MSDTLQELNTVAKKLWIIIINRSENAVLQMQPLNRVYKCIVESFKNTSTLGVWREGGVQPKKCWESLDYVAVVGGHPFSRGIRLIQTDIIKLLKT